jgi:hypothetical protein
MKYDKKSLLNRIIMSSEHDWAQPFPEYTPLSTETLQRFAYLPV